MAQTKGQDLRGLSADELMLKRQGLEKSLNELRQKKVTGQLDKPHQFKLMRRQIAQIYTIQHETKKETADAGSKASNKK